MGKPNSLKPDDVKALELASSLIKEPIHIIQNRILLYIEIAIPPQGIAMHNFGNPMKETRRFELFNSK